MSKGRRKHGPAFKAKEAQLAAQYEVHPGQIQAREKALVEGASGVLSNGHEQKTRSEATLIARLYQEVGQLKVERDFLGGCSFYYCPLMESRAPNLSAKISRYTLGESLCSLRHFDISYSFPTATAALGLGARLPLGYWSYFSGPPQF